MSSVDKRRRQGVQGVVDIALVKDSNDDDNKKLVVGVDVGVGVDMSSKRMSTTEVFAFETKFRDSEGHNQWLQTKHRPIEKSAAGGAMSDANIA